MALKVIEAALGIVAMTAMMGWLFYWCIGIVFRAFHEISNKAVVWSVGTATALAWIGIGSLALFSPAKTEPDKPPGKPKPAPVLSFCDTHSCIDSFWEGDGYIVRCADGMWSHSGGESGACSYHGGVG